MGIEPDRNGYRIGATMFGRQQSRVASAAVLNDYRVELAEFR